MAFRAGLPQFGDALVGAEGSATVQFNEWESWVDGLVISLGISVGMREPLPQDTIIEGGRPVIAYARWLGWVNASVATFGTPPKRPPLPPSNFPIVGVDKKATIPFYIWLQYVDGLLG